MLISLHLRNFRRHEALDITFEQGLNGLFGKNYAGKTAILLAIAVAIGGPSVLRGFRLARRGTDNFEVQLVLMLEGVQYRILRTKSGAKLFRILAGGDEKLVATAQGQVNIELGKLIGMPVDRWVELRFVRQKAAASMFEAGASKLNLLVEELTGVGTITQVIDRLGARLKKADVQIATLTEQRLPEEVVTRYAQELLDNRKALTVQKESVQSAEAALNTLEISVPAQQMELAAARKALTEASNLSKEKTTAEHDLRKEMTTRTSHTANKPDESLAELRTSLTEVIETHSEWQTWLGDYQEAARNLARAQKSLTNNPAPAAVADPAELEAKQEGLQARLLLTAELVTAAKAQVADSANQMLKLTEELEGGVCTSCNRPFEGQTDAHRAEIETAISKLKEVIATGRETLEEAKRNNSAAQDEADQNTRAISAAHRAVSANASAQTAHDMALANLDEDAKAFEAVKLRAPEVTEEEGKQEVALLASQIRDLGQRISNIEHYDTTLAQIDRSIAEYEKRLDDPRLKKAEDEAGIQRRRDQVEAKANKLAEDETKVSGARREVALMRTQISTLESGIERMEVQLSKAENLQIEIENLENSQVDTENLRKHLRDNRSRYLQNAWDLILGRASSFASAITEGHISELRRTEDGVFEFIEQDEVAGVTDSSGAQAAILGLAVQLALAETLPTKLDLVLADEPTADMDADHSSAAVLALSTVAKQVLVISHHRMDESLCAGVNEL